MVEEINVTATEPEPTHHISLADGVTTYAFALVNNAGTRSQRAIQRNPIQRTPLKTSTGAQKYSDLQLPYASTAQDDWSRGRANEDFDRDTARYYDAWIANTQHEGQVILGGLPTYATGYRTLDQHMPGDVVNGGGGWAAYSHVSWWKLYGSTGIGQMRYFGTKLTASGTYTATCVWLWIRQVGSPPGSLTVSLYSDNAGAIGTLLKTVTLASSEYTNQISELHRFTFASTQAISSGTVYWLVVSGGASDDASNYWSVGYSQDVVSGRTWAQSSNGSSWTYTNVSSDSAAYMYFRMTAADAPFKAYFFEYKSQLYYAAKFLDGSAVKLYMNGYRGVADSNSGDLTKLNDSTQTGWTGVLAGSIARLTDGRGYSEEFQRYRTVTAGASGVLTVEPAWYTTHIASGTDITQYAIVGANTWALLQTGTDGVTDTAVVNDMVFVASGESRSAPKVMKRYRAYTDGSTWNEQWANDTVQATYLKPLKLSSGQMLYLARNHTADRNATITRVIAPKNYNDLLVVSSPYVCNSSAGFMKEQVIANVTVTVEGTTSAKIEVADAFTTGLIASDKIASQDWRRFKRLNLSIRSTVALSSGQLKLYIDNSALSGSPIQTVDFPTLVKDITYSYEGDYLIGDAMDFSMESVTGADAVISVGLYLDTDLGAAGTIYVTFHSMQPESEDIELGTTRITGLEAYNDPEELWALGEESIWSINSVDVPSKLPLRELESVRSEWNGLSHVVHDVYLYFGLGQGVQRYFRNNLEGIGPNRDAGLPSARRGNISCMAGYAGGIFVAVDGGKNNTSSVLFYTGSGFHEVWRAPEDNMRVYSIYVQAIPGVTNDRLWISCDGDLLWIPITPYNPYYDENFRYAHESTLETAWFYQGMRDIIKNWRSVKLFTENASASQFIELYYRTDDTAAWTKVSTQITTSPVQEVTLSTSDIKAKRIQFRLSLQSLTSSETPKVVAMVVEALAVIPPKYQFAMNVKIADGINSLEDIDPEDTTYRVETIIAKLDEWAAGLTRLTLRGVFSPTDSKTVIIEPVSFQPLKTVYDEQYESHIAQIVAIEV
jgi:hypothetical protein